MPSHHKRCERCGAEFTSTRSDARYCGATCRSAAARKLTPTDTLHADLIRARDSIDHVLDLLNEKRTA